MRNYLKVLDELDKKIAANPLDKSLTLAKDRLGKSSLTDAISKRIDQLNQLEPDPTFNRATALRYGPKGLAGSINYIVDDDNLYQGVMADNGFSTMEFIDKNDKRRDTFNYYKDNNSLIQQTDNIPQARMQNKFNREYKDSVSDSEIRAKNKETPAKEVTSLSRNPTLNAIAAGMDKKKVDTTSIDEDGVFDIGKAGTFIKGIAPTIFSAIDAFTTKDNVNAYQDYGREGLETLDTAKRDLNISLNQGKNDITNQVAGAKLANNRQVDKIPYRPIIDLTNEQYQSRADENPIPFLPGIENKPQTSNRIIDDLEKEKTPEDIGKAGTFIKGIAPAIFSAIDAFTTKDNVNVYQDYGREGLETLDTAKRDLNISLNQGKNDITNQVAGAKLANNNSTRSLNVARALNLSSDLVGQDAQNKLAAQTTDRRINLDTVIANAENQRDSVVMKGADEKQVRDAEDRSKIISNFSGAAQAIGSSKEHIGKMVNENNYNSDVLTIVNTLFPNIDFSKDAKGNLTVTRKKVG